VSDNWIMSAYMYYTYHKIRNVFLNCQTSNVYVLKSLYFISIKSLMDF